jgi:hypothetical protein
MVSTHLRSPHLDVERRRSVFDNDGNTVDLAPNLFVFQAKFITLLLHEEEVQENELALRRAVSQAIKILGEFNPPILEGMIALNEHPGRSINLLETQRKTTKPLQEGSQLRDLPFVGPTFGPRSVEPELDVHEKLVDETLLLLRRHKIPLSSVLPSYTPKYIFCQYKNSRIASAVLFFSSIYFLFAKYFFTAASVAGPYQPVEGMAFENSP